jgi:uncharacterized protein YdaU (DUF1376 family)
MTKPTAWMPMYWGDYLRDTGHLTTHQHGAYLLLIAHYWSSGQALPDDDLRLAKIARITPHLWNRTRGVIETFFKVENGRWHHPRIERELLAAFDRKDAATARAKHAAETRWGHAPSMPQAIVTNAYHSHSHSKTHDSVSKTSTGAARDPAPDRIAPGRAHAKPDSTLEALAAIARAKFLKGETE